MNKFTSASYRMIHLSIFYRANKIANKQQKFSLIVMGRTECTMMNSGSKL